MKNKKQKLVSEKIVNIIEQKNKNTDRILKWIVQTERLNIHTKTLEYISLFYTRPYNNCRKSKWIDYVSISIANKTVIIELRSSWSTDGVGWCQNRNQTHKDKEYKFKNFKELYWIIEKNTEIPLYCFE